MEQRFSVPNPFLPPIRRKVFISYHEADTTEVENFIKTFGPNGQGVFTHKAVGLFGQGDFVDSTNPEYVMSQIRAKYLEDSSVTIVLLGHCTHSRRYVDWELKASLTQPALGLPSGVLGIVLPSLTSAHLPERFRENWQQNNANCYAKLWAYPASGQGLRDMIEEAHAARGARAHLITNSREMMGYSANCRVHNRVCNTESTPKPSGRGALLDALGALQPKPSWMDGLALHYAQQQKPKPTPYMDLLKALEPKPFPYDALLRRLNEKKGP